MIGDKPSLNFSAGLLFGIHDYCTAQLDSFFQTLTR